MGRCLCYKTPFAPLARNVVAFLTAGNGTAQRSPERHNPAMHWSEVWDGEGVGPALARTALTPLSWLYAAGWEAYASVYRLGLKKPAEPHVPVVCVGNLVAGGSGKSPITLFLADQLLALGRQVVTGCSGYGSPHAESAAVAPDGELDAGEWGDEPAMFRWLRPGVPLIVGRNRVHAAELCHEHFPHAVLLMDDGFQHLPLRKHISILLDPTSDNQRCLPAGPYREPRKNGKYADLVLPDGMRAVFSPAGLADPSGTSVSLGAGSRINVLCAIGSPHRFVRDLEAAGLEIVERRLLPDHENLAAGNLLTCFDPAFPLVVTAKDWVKLRKRTDLSNFQILIARQEASIEPRHEFTAWLKQKLDELPTERPPR